MKRKLFTWQDRLWRSGGGGGQTGVGGGVNGDVEMDVVTHSFRDLTTKEKRGISSGRRGMWSPGRVYF